MKRRRAREPLRASRPHVARRLAAPPRINGPFIEFSMETFAAYQAARNAMDQALLGEDGLLRILSVENYVQWPFEFLRLWMHELGYFVLPTVELVAWFRDQIGNRSALEICAGSGVLGRALGVRSIDARIHKKPLVRAQYAELGQPVPCIGQHVEDLEALEAVEKYSPQVVFGTYVTERFRPGDPPSKKASIYGVDESAILRRVETYIVVGSEAVNGGKKIHCVPHQVVRPPGAVSRGRPGTEVAYIWNMAGGTEQQRNAR